MTRIGGCLQTDLAFTDSLILLPFIRSTKLVRLELAGSENEQPPHILVNNQLQKSLLHVKIVTVVAGVFTSLCGG